MDIAADDLDPGSGTSRREPFPRPLERLFLISALLLGAAAATLYWLHLRTPDPQLLKETAALVASALAAASGLLGWSSRRRRMADEGAADLLAGLDEEAVARLGVRQYGHLDVSSSYALHQDLLRLRPVPVGLVRVYQWGTLAALAGAVGFAVAAFMGAGRPEELWFGAAFCGLFGLIGSGYWHGARKVLREQQAESDDDVDAVR